MSEFDIIFGLALVVGFIVLMFFVIRDMKDLQQASKQNQKKYELEQKDKGNLDAKK